METYKVDTANSGKAKYLIYANPELELIISSSVETLYGVPKAKAMAKSKSGPQTHCGNESCSGMNQ